MESDFHYQSLTTADFYASLPVNQSTWPIQYTFGDPTGAHTNGIYVLLDTQSTNTVPLNSQYVGLYGLAQACTISAKASPINVSGVSAYNVPATVSETLQFASIPLFQFAIFYNINLEIDPGANMPINGAVFSNAGIWSGGAHPTYNSTVSAHATVNTSGTDPFVTGKTDANGGTPSGNFKFTPINNAHELTMPIGTNNNPATVEGIISLPPPAYAMGTSAAYSTNGQIYLANAADLYLTNFPTGINSSTPTGTNMIMYYQDAANNASPLTQVPYDFFILSNAAPTGFYTNNVVTNRTAGVDCYTNVKYAGYSFVTNAIFYDWREGWNNGSGPPKAVQAVQLDISKFNLWVTNTAANGGNIYNAQCSLSSHKNHPIDSIYVYNAVPLTGTTLPAVRVMNGTNLPSTYGFTVVTRMPMYVWGNYNIFGNGGTQLGQGTNTTYTYPAALMADAITVLSTAWNDANSTFANKSTDTTGGPTPGNTTVNAAMLEGIVQSTNAIYSGGVENFMRLLESWNDNSGYTLTYNGSIVVMFPSQYATNYQQATTKYYNAPSRKWGFDANFTKQSGLPPLTPQSKAIIRGQWMDQ
ncbi:MAG TPA: hypothetical protein VHY30_09780 [Verrucomicrobiae bacterium]|nr:hypothetical protein [Verrucomicrobiae bacterium]